MANQHLSQPIAKSGKCGEKIFWSLDDDGNLTITGTGEMNANYRDRHWGKDIKTVKISDGITNILDKAFSGCSALTSVTIPNSVTSIGTLAFFDCCELTSITVDVSNKYYDSRDNCNAIIEKSTGTLILGCAATKIPNSVTSIGRSAFSGCNGLTSVTIPNSVTSIGDYAFSGCTALSSVTIGNSVTSIGNSAFEGCTKLSDIAVKANNPPTCKYDVFKGIYKINSKLIIPIGSLSDYKSTDN